MGMIKPNFDDFVPAIKKAIQSEIEAIVIDEAKKAAERVEKRVRDKSAEMAVSLINHFSFEKIGQHLRISVDLGNSQGEFKS